MLFAKLLPREGNFFEMFNLHADHIVEAAHAMGRRVTAHAHGAGGINAALRAGVDSIEHGSYTDQTSLRLFRQQQEWEQKQECENSFHGARIKVTTGTEMESGQTVPRRATAIRMTLL